MPKTCIHMEKIKMLLDKWEIKLSIYNINDCIFKSTLSKGNHALFRSNYVEAADVRKLRNIGAAYLIMKHDLEDVEKHLKEIRSELLSAINQCNCESENNQQLVLARDNNRTDLIRFQERNEGLQRENSRLGDLIRMGERALDKKDDQIKQINNQLTTTQNDRDDYKNKWVLSDKEVKKITDSFNALQIEKNKKETEINSLQEEVKNLQNIDIRYKDRKLDELIRNSGLNRPRVINLRDAYEKLHKRDDVINANREIETIKAEFFQTNVAINDLHKIYKTCEKIAELRVKQEKIHEQQYQAHQEQPTNNN